MKHTAATRATVAARALVWACMVCLCGLGVAHAQPPAPAASAASAIGYKQEGEFGPLVLQAGLVLLGLGAAFVAGAYGLKRLRGSVLAPATRRLRVLETLRLAPRTTLWLVEMDGRPVLLGQHGQQLSLLVAPTADAPRAGAPPAPPAPPLPTNAAP